MTPYEQDTKLIKKLTDVVLDFMPNIGVCDLQNYGRLNEALIESERRVGRRGKKT